MVALDWGPVLFTSKASDAAGRSGDVDTPAGGKGSGCCLMLKSDAESVRTADVTIIGTSTVGLER